MQDVIPAWVNGVLQPVEKLAVHQRALRHRAVSVFVVAGGAVAGAKAGAWQISYARPVGQHLLHAPPLGRG